MSTSEAVDLVREIFLSGETCMMKVAEELLDLSLDKGERLLQNVCTCCYWLILGSKDNISATVARLPAAVFGPVNGGGVEGRRQDRAAAQKAKQDAAVSD